MSAQTTSEQAGTPRPGAPPERSLHRLQSVWSAPAPVFAPAESDRDAAMRELYERTHADMVRFAAFLCGDAHQAEDVAHEAYVQVFGAWDRIDDTDRIDAYLRVTVVNAVRSRHRRQEVADRHERTALRLVNSAEDDALGRVGHERLLAAVAALPIRQRTCVVMRHWMRMTESEIATELGVSIGSVRTHIKRGTKALERQLGGRS